MEQFEQLQIVLDEGLQELTTLWRDIGLDQATVQERKKMVLNQVKNITDRMLNEEKSFKTGLLESLEHHSGVCQKLSKEMGVR